MCEFKNYDRMFAYSGLANKATLQTKVGTGVNNGLSRLYVGKAPRLNYKIGEPVLVYRRYTQGDGK